LDIGQITKAQQSRTEETQARGSQGYRGRTKFHAGAFEIRAVSNGKEEVMKYFTPPFAVPVVLFLVIAAIVFYRQIS